MNSQKKHLNKKRKHIFIIQKNPSTNEKEEKFLSEPQKNSTKISISLVNEENDSQEIHNTNSNLEEYNKRENKPYSLIEISRLVQEFIMKQKNTTGNQVTEYVKNYLHPKKSDEAIQKNIQRRVYDAINVMSAVGLIKKNKQQIKVIEYNNNNNNNNYIHLNENIGENNNNINNGNEEKYIEKEIQLERLQKELIKKYFYIKFYEKINKLNQVKPGRVEEENIIFPFDLIKCDKRAPVKIKKNEDSTRYVLFSDSELLHYDEYDIVKYFVGPDILKKLNNIHNNDDASNNSNNKSNSKKSTSEESFIDINDNNKYISNDDMNDKRVNFGKNEYNENEIFNYLKNLKLFRDELNSINLHKCEEIFENKSNEKNQENNKEDDTLNDKAQLENNRIYKTYGEDFMKPEFNEFFL